MRRLIGSGQDGYERPSVAFDVSPNGDYIAYGTLEYPDPPQESASGGGEAQGSEVQRADGFHREIARMHIDSGRRERITRNAEHDYVPALSPDGTRLTFVRSLGWLQLFTSRPDGSDSRLLVSDLRHPTRGSLEIPVWSPDGQRIAIAAGDDDLRQPEEAIYVIEANSGSTEYLTVASSVPAWSPDGRRLAFAKLDGEEMALYTVAVDGSDLQRVTTIVNWRIRVQVGIDIEGPTPQWIPHVAWSRTAQRSSTPAATRPAW